ncbi:hypothetical protein BDF22DRAFT_742266 [Syncephalis plumigaleata]|nr:hypothetical protein BDF22DRAFT_742266 [Syncephalis plumigaleata]
MVSSNNNNNNSSSSSRGCQIDFRDVTYSVTTSRKKVKTILHGVSGTFRAGRVTAIIGPTGTGKTCLLSALAGQSNQGQVTGSLYLNGQPVNSKRINKLTGFVHQDSLIYDTLTVREALEMSVKMRCSRSLSVVEQNRRIHEILRVLHLEHVANTIIGNTLKRGISGGEKKRVCVGMELITEPVVLFLDEPTTGLDALAAYQLVKTLHDVATLAILGHAWTSRRHILYGRGTSPLRWPYQSNGPYFARYSIECPTYSNPVDYLFLKLFYTDADGIEEQEDILQIDECTIRQLSLGTANNLLLRDDRDATPIDLMSGIRKPSVDRRLEMLFKDWSNKQNELQRSAAYSLHHSTPGQITYRKERASFFAQYKYLVQRGFRDRLRNPNIIILRFAQILVASILVDFVYWQLPRREQSVQITDRARYLFFVCASVLSQFSYDTATTFCLARKLFMREYRDGYFGVPAFFFSMLTIEIPLYVTLGVTLGLSTYFAVGMPGGTDRIVTFCLVCALMALAGMMMGVAVSCLTDKYEIVSSASSIFSITLLMFGGLLSNLNASPSWIHWIQWISPVKYGFVALLRNESDNYEIGCGDDPPPQCRPVPASISVKQYGADSHGSIYFNIAMLLVFWIAVSCLAYLGYYLRARSIRSSYTRGFKKSTHMLK